MRRSTHTVPLFLLAAVLGLLAVLLSPARAAAPETRVGASTSFAATRVGVATAETRALQPGNNATYDGVASGDLFAADTALTDAGGIADDSTVFRIWGGKADELGHSWSPTDPASLDNPRDAFGLPDVNAGTNVTRAEITDWTGVSARRALPLDGNSGGEIEYLIPNPASQLQILERLLAEPPY